ncbi:autotransporter domain-containing protein (plasmid) [Pseudomonas silvicola]|nr:autotransporter domain-containing protein [Pseudomonas silvicola]
MTTCAVIWWRSTVSSPCSIKGWINADHHYADLDFDSIERNINIGPATRTEQGNSSGKLLGMRVQTGWDLPLGTHITTGPVASYALDYGRGVAMRKWQ